VLRPPRRPVAVFIIVVFVIEIHEIIVVVVVVVVVEILVVVIEVVVLIIVQIVQIVVLVILIVIEIVVQIAGVFILGICVARPLRGQCHAPTGRTSGQEHSRAAGRSRRSKRCPRWIPDCVCYGIS
jgi:hypothetical protein